MVFGKDDNFDLKPIVRVVGVGGGGGNAVNRMVENDVKGVIFCALNTDAQDLKRSRAEERLQLGRKLTKGLGAGQKPEIGREAALESEDEIRTMLQGTDMVFVTCGMGGGTGTGAAPVVARISKELGCLTVGIVTKPFQMEGPIRMRNALEGIANIKPYVDTLIVIPNQRLLSIADRNTKLLDSFREADKVLRYGVQGIAEIIAIPGLINVDFADVKTVIGNAGTAHMGIGIASGPDRAVKATRDAIHSQILEVSIQGATNAIVSISTSDNLGMFEVEAVLQEVRNATSPDISIIWGTIINLSLKDELVVTVIATGLDQEQRDKEADELGLEVGAKIQRQAGYTQPGQSSNQTTTTTTGSLPSWLKKK